MNKKQGFILKPETYNQKEWYELFMNLSKEYRKKCNIINELEKFLNKVVETGSSIEQITCKNIFNYLQELKENNK